MELTDGMDAVLKEVRDLSKIIKKDLYKKEMMEAFDHRVKVQMAISKYESMCRAEGMSDDDIKALEGMGRELQKVKCEEKEKNEQYQDVCKL